MDDKLLFEIVRVVNTSGWAHIEKYFEEKQAEALSEVLNQSGEEVFKSVGKLKVYRDMLNLKKTISSKYEEQKKEQKNG